MILSATVGSNADLFPSVLDLYVKPESKILDMSYGKGAFWTSINRDSYNLTTNDLVTDADGSHDFRFMPFESETFDAVVLDPPYAYSPKGTIKSSIADCYKLNDSVDISNMDKVRQLYADGIDEAARLLKKKGVLIVKTQDIIQAGKQWWMHLWVMQRPGWLCEDLFVLLQKSTPAADPKWKQQHHARKNHSFFVVLRKP